MIYKRFGQTELQMPLITLGTMRFQHKWEDVAPEDIPKANQENLEAVLDEAMRLGVNHFETARGYGTSEMQIGRVLPKYDRESYILQSKVPPTEDPKEFLEKFERTMEYLGQDYLDLLAIHGVNDPTCIDWTLKKGGALDVAKRLQKEGRVRHIGFSSHAFPHEILKLIETDEFSFVNLHYYYINQFNLECVQEAGKRDMGILVISPNDKGGKLYENPQTMAQACQPLHPMEFNSLFCLQRPEIGTLSMGIAKPEQLAIHVENLQNLKGSAPQVTEITARLDGIIEENLGAGWLSQWHQGLPSLEMSPNEINIFDCLRIYTYGKGLGLDAFGKARYNMFGKGGHWFRGQKPLRFDEKEILRVCENSPIREKIPEILSEVHRLFDDHEESRLAGPRNTNDEKN